MNPEKQTPLTHDNKVACKMLVKLTPCCKSQLCEKTREKKIGQKR